MPSLPGPGGFRARVGGVAAAIGPGGRPGPHAQGPASTARFMYTGTNPAYGFPESKTEDIGNTVQILINGLLQGILIGVVGVAFALGYRAAGVFHIALGGIYALAPYLLFTGLAAGLAPWQAVPLVIGAAALAGVLVEESIHWPFECKGAHKEVHLIASLGVYLILVQCIVLIWGNEVRILRVGVDQTWSLLGVIVTQAQMLGPLMALLAILLLFAWLHRADRGLELRALSDNPGLIALLGRDVRRARRWVFGLSGVLAALAAMAKAWDVGFAPHNGLHAVLLGMVATIIGGTGNFAGPLLAGMALGVLRAQVGWLASARWEEAATFVLLAVFLFWRPYGLFDRNRRLEEDK